MHARVKSVQEYLDELERSKRDKPEQIREALEIYLGLWKKALSSGVVVSSDGIDVALAKIEESGGLYQATGS